MKKEKGITLIALVITVVVLLILASVSIQYGTETIENTRLQGFYMQLEIIQKRVDVISSTNESYSTNINGVETTIELKESGNNLTSEQIEFLQNVLEQGEITITTANNFKYFTIQDLEEKLDLHNMEYNVFIDFENRIVVAENGIDIEGKKYYILKNERYTIEQNKNTVTIDSLSYTVTEFGEMHYKVTIIPNNSIEDVEKLKYVKYKSTNTKYWETLNKNEIILKLGIEYNLIYTDNNNNSIEKTIKVQLDDKNNKPTIIEITEK